MARCLSLLLWVAAATGTRLLKQDLEDHSLAVCNDGSTASYYYDQDVRTADRRVLIYLPDGGDCSSVEDCRRR